MSTHYSDAQLEEQYNNQRRVPEFPHLLEHWRQRSAALQATSDCRLDLTYGEGSRDRFDYYACGKVDAPALVYLHGGYWQGGDKSLYGFLTPGPLAAGFNVAIVNYNLCPHVALEEITPQLARALIHLRAQAVELEFDPQQIYLSGHSAGGHLTAALLATDFSHLDPDLPVTLIQAGISISGLFDLVPLIPTSINTVLDLNKNRAEALSPLRMRTVSTAPLLACVGGDESEEFHRQSRAISQAWSPSCRYLELPGCNHFSILESLADSNGQLCASLRELRGSIV